MINTKNIMGAAASLGLLTSASAGLALGDEALQAMAHAEAAANVDASERGYIIDWSAGAEASVGNPDIVEGSAKAEDEGDDATFVEAHAGVGTSAEGEGDAAVGNPDTLQAALNLALNFAGVADPDD
jgi:hypothetical protein